MVAIGLGLVALAAWFAWSWWRHREIPLSPWFLRAAALSGVGAVVAMEAGWVVTEVGRQPWVVYGILLTKDAVNPAPGLRVGLVAVLLVYTALTVATVFVLRRLAKAGPVPAGGIAPQESPWVGSDEPDDVTRAGGTPR